MIIGMDQNQTGRRFSQVYLSGGEGLPDSDRARIRVGRLIESIGLSSYELAEAFQSELGVTVPWGPGGPMVQTFIQNCELRDFLDAITIVYSTSTQNVRSRAGWLPECRRIFSEERLRYIIDDAGGVRRFSVDHQFEADVQTTLQGLGHPALKAALAGHEHCLEAMSEFPPHGNTAIRSIFDAVETVFKTMCSGPRRRGDFKASDSNADYSLRR
jgi:hypothetical protein